MHTSIQGEQKAKLRIINHVNLSVRNVITTIQREVVLERTR
jgi:hypothetical protein